MRINTPSMSTIRSNPLIVQKKLRQSIYEGFVMALRYALNEALYVDCNILRYPGWITRARFLSKALNIIYTERCGHICYLKVGSLLLLQF